MRITIDLEAHELQQAQDLILALKALTDNLQVNTTSGGSGLAQRLAAAAPAAAAPHATDATSARHAPGVLPSGAQPAGSTGLVMHPQSVPLQQHVQPVQSPATAPAPSVSPEKRTPSYNILASLTNASQVDSVAMALSSALMAREQHEAISELVDAFETVVFPPYTPGVPPDSDRVELYFQLLAHKLPDVLSGEFRKGVLQRVLRQLTRPREVVCDRLELLPYAVGFSVLVRLECVKMAGALQTVERLLSKPTNCAAAITMLCKTLSVCGPMVASVPQAILDKVWSSVEGTHELQEPSYAHDRDYVNSWRSYWQKHHEPPSNMVYQLAGEGAAGTTSPYSTANGSTTQSHGSTTPGPHDQATAGSLQQTGEGAQIIALSPQAMLQLKAPGVCLAWDAASATGIVSCTDRTVSAWHVANKQEVGRIDMPGAYGPVSCISTSPTHGQMLMAANPAQHSTACASLLLHATVPGMPRRGTAYRQRGALITSTLLLPHEESYGVSCESWAGTLNAAVCLWDMTNMNAVNPNVPLDPLHTYLDGHTASITCSASSPSSAHTFFTGAQDGVVRVWDTRMRTAAGALSVPDMGGKAHTGGVSTMDAAGHVLVTAGSDAAVCMWDLRQLGSTPSMSVTPMLNMVVEGPDVPIYKVAYHNAPSTTTAALATGSGLYMLDWTDGSNPTMTPTPGYHGNEALVLLQHDIAWAPGSAHGGGLGLVGLSSQPMLTVFSLNVVQAA